MKQTPAISVIMLTHKNEKYLGRAIESVLNQTYTDFELILVNNGSTDDCRLICERYKSQDHRISVIIKEKGNIGSGRNAGLSVARGEFLVFVDDDDIAERGLLEFLYKLIVEYQADISICGSWYLTDGMLKPKYIYDHILELETEQGVVELLKREYYNIASAAKMFRRTIIPQHPYSERGLVDDINTVYKFFERAQKVIAHGIPQYSFSRHSGNLTAFTTDFRLLTPEILREYLNAFRSRTVYLSERLPGIKDFIHYAEWCFMFDMCEKITQYNLDNCSEQLKFMHKTIMDDQALIEANPHVQTQQRKWLATLMRDVRVGLSDG